MRMFAALVPPEEAVADLDAFLEPRRDAGPDLRWTDPEQWHVTLAFMAQVPDRALEGLLGEVGGAVAAREPVAVRLTGGGAFPNPYAARVVWTGLDGEEQQNRVAGLARAVRRACSHAGGAPQGGPFHPHVTLARSKRPIEATRWLRVLDGYAGPGWVAREVTLVASHLGEGRGRRPRYEPVAVLPLAG